MRRGLRVVMHPDQFVVLNSESEQVVQNSINILEMHARTFDYLGLPESQWATLEIHGGKRGRAAELIRCVRELPKNIWSRLALENDEGSYGAEDILGVCRESVLPMVFDAHHHAIYEGLDSYDHPSVEHYFKEARKTWKDPAMQMVHISNGREFFGDRRHHDFISALLRCYADAPWIATCLSL